jgi:hypothetical protein
VRSGSTDVEWWRERSAGCGSLVLPEDRDDTAPGVGPALTRTAPVAPAVVARSAARDRRLSVYAIGLGAFASVLARWTSNGLLRFGASVDLRPLVDAGDVVGPMSQGALIPVTVDPAGDAAVAAVTVQRAVLAALGHQAARFESVVGLLTTRGLPAEQIARVTVDQLTRPAPRRWAQVRVARLDVDLGVAVGAGSDLHLNVADDPATGLVALTVDANAGRFSPKRVDALLGETARAFRECVGNQPASRRFGDDRSPHRHPGRAGRSGRAGRRLVAWVARRRLATAHAMCAVECRRAGCAPGDWPAPAREHAGR